ncbi:hypothetical protein EGW08_013427 [Elysia chlorotica]|uniref:Phospholipid-transporting ATPase n=1 Tax=Elysia chlorotica TaxID=188477 RepID=A0A433TB71_ELYCH|nr:hypothetical protein EGW08_013427 [Elysia chlorotica]
MSNNFADPSLTFVQKLFTGRRPPRNRKVYVDSKILPGDDALELFNYPDNRVISSKYTLLTFLPKNLFEQFRRIANFYFLCVALTQFMIDTPVTPITSVLPLLFVISITAIKQGYEDYLRHNADKEVNLRPAVIIRNGQVQKGLRAMDVKVGDIVKTYVNEEFPCDMILLSSEDQSGHCFITTANLDGETNLKTHYSQTETRKLRTPQALGTLRASITCKPQTADLYMFQGVMHFGHDADPTPLGPEHLLLRGARLKNTPWVYGCAIYTGKETKMALNSTAKKAKFSRVERKLNVFLILFLVLLVLFCVVPTCFKYWFEDKEGDDPWYFYEKGEDKNDDASDVLETGLAFMVLVNYIIPISLYVTIEMQKFFGSLFFNYDVEMYDPELNEPALANTSDLNEELGQVEYLFTDKTGTLTENTMTFRKCIIGKRLFEEVDGMLCEKTQDNMIPVTDPSYQVSRGVLLYMLAFVNILSYAAASSRPQSVAGSELSFTGQDYEYQASSPDEKAFVEACSKYGTIYHGLVDDTFEVSYRKEVHRFKLLETLPFDAVRKRMSVIIRDVDGDIYLLCKGAEIAIFDRVIEGDVEITQRSIDDYATCGYRTLCLARRKLSELEYQNLSEKLTEARLSLVDREAKVGHSTQHFNGKRNLCNFYPPTMEISVWVLTGDKEETAVNISHSAGHFRADMTELRLTQVASSEQCREQLLHLLKLVKHNPDKDQSGFSLVVDGKSLAYALRKHPDWLRELCSHCVAVLCCRMSPIQKAEVVKMVKASPGQPVTAAIGDGANDVSMIQEADVGFGIMGKEGRQAVCNSDFAFGKFRFLRRALLLHGYYYYHRLAVLVKYFFYKNVAWITCQIYFAIFNYWSQQSLYDPFYLTFYNMTSTSLPILIYGIFEQRKPKQKLINQPHIYKSISRNASLRWKVFIEWMLLAVWHSLVFFFAMYFMEEDNTSLFSSGYSIGVYDFGTVIAYAGIISVNLKLMLETYYWCWPMTFSYCFTCAGTITMAVLYTCIFWPSWVTTTRDLYGVPGQIYKSLAVWLCLVLTIVAALLPDFVLRILRDNRDALEEQEMERKSGESQWSEEYLKNMSPEDFVPGNSSNSRNTRNSSLAWNARATMQDPAQKHILRGKATLALGKIEMMLHSREAQLPNDDSDIELHDVKSHSNYGTVGQTGRYDKHISPGSDTRNNLAEVPTVATVKSGQRENHHQLHDNVRHYPHSWDWPNGNSSSLDGSAATQIENHSITNGSLTAKTSDSKESHPSQAQKLNDSETVVSNGSSNQVGERNPPQTSQRPLSPPEQTSDSLDSSLSAESPPPRLSAPLFLRHLPQTPQAVPAGQAPADPARVSDTAESESGGHDNPAFSLASEQTDRQPSQQTREGRGKKHVSIVDIVVRL